MSLPKSAQPASLSPSHRRRGLIGSRPRPWRRLSALRSAGGHYWNLVLKCCLRLITVQVFYGSPIFRLILLLVLRRLHRCDTPVGTLQCALRHTVSSQSASTVLLSRRAAPNSLRRGPAQLRRGKRRRNETPVVRLAGRWKLLLQKRCEKGRQKGNGLCAAPTGCSSRKCISAENSQAAATTAVLWAEPWRTSTSASTGTGMWVCKRCWARE